MVMTIMGNDRDKLHIVYYETTQKRQGVIELILSDPADQVKIHDDDTVDIKDLDRCAPGETVTLVLHHSDHATEEIQAQCA